MTARAPNKYVTVTSPKEPQVRIDEPSKPVRESTGALPKDLDLIRGLLCGDERSFVALLENYHGQLIRLALAYVGDRAVAEEVVQETWLAVLNGLRSFKSRSSLKTWIFAILTNKEERRPPLPPFPRCESRVEENALRCLRSLVVNPVLKKTPSAASEHRDGHVSFWFAHCGQEHGYAITYETRKASPTDSV